MQIYKRARARTAIQTLLTSLTFAWIYTSPFLRITRTMEKIHEKAASNLAKKENEKEIENGYFGKANFSITNR